MPLPLAFRPWASAAFQNSVGGNRSERVFVPVSGGQFGLCDLQSVLKPQVSCRPSVPIKEQFRSTLHK
eukprot:scaffold8600_cov35-Attheya_sp.AAC.2